MCNTRMRRGGLAAALRGTSAVAVAVAVGLLAPAAGAHTPPFVELDVDAPGEIATGSSLHGTITLRNPLQAPVVVELHDRKGHDVGIDVPASSLTVTAGGRATTPITVTVDAIGAFVARPSVTVRTADGQLLGTTDGTLGVRRTRDGVRADPSALHSVAPAIGDTKRWPGPYRDFAGVDPLEVGDLAAMVKRGGLSGSRDLGAEPPPDGGDPPYDPGSALDELRAPWTAPTGPNDTGPQQPPTPPERVNPVPHGCIGGKLVIRTEHGPASSKEPTKELLGAFGWSAMVDIYDRDAPLKLVRTQRVELDSLGEWDYCPSSFSEIDAPFNYHYESITRYVAVLDQDTDKPHRILPPDSGSTHDGHLPFGDDDPVTLSTLLFDSSDSEGQDYGVGDVVRWGMEWALSLAASGVDPDPLNDEEADDQIAPIHEVVYPNYTEDCGGAGTCFKHPETNRVYIYGAKVWVDPFVVKHELSHSLHYFAWSGLPGGGGAHPLDKCVERELAAAEGFADFLALWVDNPDKPGGVDVTGWYAQTGPHGPEHPYASLCDLNDAQNAGASNEVWVAGALWDLADHHDDGADVTGTASWGAIPRIWLSMPWLSMKKDANYKWTMAAFEQHYKGKIDAKWHPWVTKVFDQNGMHN